MLGLRTNISEKFMRYFALVQAEAEKSGNVFFTDGADSNDFETDEMEGVELMGWLIPKEHAEEFQKIYENSGDTDDWIDYYCWAEWEMKDGEIKIHFAFYD